MKNTFLVYTVVAGMLMCRVGAVAQSLTSSLYSIEKIDNSPFLGIFRVSDNGKYAVASEGVTSDDYTTMAGVMWDSETRSFSFVNEYDGTMENGVILHDVANDGMIVGAFPKLIIPNDGTDTYYQWQPGCKYLDSEWIELPLPEQTNLKYPLDIAYCSFAKRVSPDGRIVMGEIYYGDSIMTDGTIEYVSRWEPMLWYLNEDKEVVDTQLFTDIDYVTIGFIPYDMSADGRIIVGKMSTPRGSEYYPAMIIDGQLTPIAEPKLVKQEGYDNWYLEDSEGYSEEPYAYWDGLANCIDNDGNVYYYYYDGVEELHSGSKNVYTGATTKYDDIVACGIEGFVVGMSKVLVGNSEASLSGLYTVLNMSNDGTVVAGGGASATVWGEEYNYPALIVFSESPIETHIDVTPADGVSVSEFYTITGVRVTEPLRKGVYIIDGKKVYIKD